MAEGTEVSESALLELRRVLAAGGAVHLDASTIVVAGMTLAELQVPSGELAALLSAEPELEEAERARRRIYERLLDALRPRFREALDRGATLETLRERAPQLSAEVDRAVDALCETWVDARRSAKAAARFPDAIRRLRAAWTAALAPEDEVGK